MTWNYRVLRKEGCLAIHEVYYDKEGTPKSCTVDPVIPTVYEQEETYEDFKSIFPKYLEALNKPILDYDNFDT